MKNTEKKIIIKQQPKRTLIKSEANKAYSGKEEKIIGRKGYDK